MPPKVSTITTTPDPHAGPLHARSTRGPEVLSPAVSEGAWAPYAAAVAERRWAPLASQAIFGSRARRSTHVVERRCA